MSGVPILVEADGLRVLIVGGGAVATRKARQFAMAGAIVRIVAIQLDADLDELVIERGFEVERRPYASGDIDDAQLIVAATDDRHVNAAVARDADASCRLLNAADHSGDGNFAMMAAHRRGPLTIAVSAGGVP
ncbi:MAG: bifunctional precorrin-2 dehydrogenase/sirohydrochlorin ferrochelatase, partial [bacterium]